MNFLNFVKAAEVDLGVVKSTVENAFAKALTGVGVAYEDFAAVETWLGKQAPAVDALAAEVSTLAQVLAPLAASNATVAVSITGAVAAVKLADTAVDNLAAVQAQAKTSGQSQLVTNAQGVVTVVTSVTQALGALNTAKAQLGQAVVSAKAAA